ncbi:glycosyltransferase [Ruegeria lacuscaerulensis]|uniref:glycosyltransferase n=1 Tax=Ruegeria lacuscaerulensis TaxID=55218 RepID=UPI00147B3C3D|nr:glycosyltransferase [Ruegeria lacuscaerulensis]
MSKNAIVFTANTMHVAQANLMIESLFDPEKGNFNGDLWVISTHLSAGCQEYLESRGIRFLINPLTSFQNWKYRRDIARSQPEFLRGKLEEDDAFLLYRNKRMSKLIINDWVEKFGRNYDAVALCDNDLYFQRDINDLFHRTAQSDPDALWYWQEENRNLPGTNLWMKNAHYSRLHASDGLDFGQHEINIGFVISSPRTMRSIFRRVEALFSSCHIELFRDCLWHDQDLVRLIRAQDPKLFRLFEEGDVLHLCNGGENLLDERSPQEFFHKKTKEKPYVVHFAGGAWRGYRSIAPSYLVDENAYFFVEEQTERFDEIRQLTDYDPFDAPSPFFTEHNIETKAAAREEWMKLTADSQKKRMLFFSWLDTGSHRPLRGTLADFLDNNEFDLAVIDGNVNANGNDGLIAEDLPDLLAHVTRTVFNNRFGRQFGLRRSDIPEEAISDAIAALVKEYGCSQRNARAVANAAYIYLSKAISYYRPDVVVGWGAYLLCSRILRQICKQRGIPFLTMELGVLPETLAFDCLGHMGESWVAQNFDAFNALPLADADRLAAKNYLEKTRRDRPTRNVKIDVSPSDSNQLLRLKSSGKKIVAYIGSNCAFSGHVPYDDNARTYHSPFFSDNDDVVRNLSEAFAGDLGTHLVYKPHPISITRGLDLEDEYPNVTVLKDVNLDDCLQIADLALVKVSQSNYEALLRDTPVLMLGRNQLNGSGAVYELSGRDALRDDILNALQLGLTSAQKTSFEDHVARLLKYYVYSVSGAEFGRPQLQVTEDIETLLNASGPKRLEAEQIALNAHNKSAQPAEGTPALSIIMPVFNGEQYLADCIGSILSQSFGDFELLCVNNGSTDGSQEILDYFARRDTRVKPLYQEESNQRSARNLGVKQAKGTYLHFFDCDDLLVPNAYEKLLSAMQKTKADVLYFFFGELYNVSKTGRPRHREFQNYLPQQGLFEMEEQHKRLFAQYPFPWAKVFKADFFRDKDLYFDLDCANFDDNPQNLRTLLSSQNIFVLNKPFYKFRINQNSMTQSVNPRVIGMLDAVRLMNEIFTKFGRYDEFQKYYVPYKIHLLHFAWTRLPEDLKEAYLAGIPNLFLSGDDEYFERDDLASMFSYMSPEKVGFIRSALRGEIPKAVSGSRDTQLDGGSRNTGWMRPKADKSKKHKRIFRSSKRYARGLARSLKRASRTLRGRRK